MATPLPPLRGEMNPYRTYAEYAAANPMPNYRRNPQRAGSYVDGFVRDGGQNDWGAERTPGAHYADPQPTSKYGSDEYSKYGVQMDGRGVPDEGPRGGYPPSRPRGPRPTGQRPGEYGPPDPNPIQAPVPGPGNTFPRPVPNGPAPHTADLYGGYSGDPYTDGVNGAFQANAMPPMPTQPSYDAGGPPQYSPNLGDEDPYRMAMQDRTSAYDRGNRIDQDFRDEAIRRYGLEEGYRGRADASYEDLYNNPGYTPDEQRNILREDDLTRYNLTPEQVQGFQFTENERAGILGDPGSQYNWFNPEQTEGIANETGGRMNNALDVWGNQGRGAWSGMSENTRSAIGAANLLPAQDYMNQQDAALLGGQQGIRGAFDSGEGAVRGFTGSDALGVSGDFMQNYQFGQEDADKMVTSAATTIGNETAANKDRVARAASASGYNSPMALNAGLQELQRTGDANAADARLAAEVAAKRLGLDVTRGREDTRLGAEQYRAGLGANSELALQGRRIAGEGALMNAGLGAAGEREGFRSNAERTRMAADLQNEQYLGSRLMDFENQHGRAAIDTADRAGTQRQQANQFNQTTGVDIARDVDRQNSARNLGIATNRQATDIGGQRQMYDQNFGTNRELANRYGVVADARRGDQQTARGYWGGQSTQQGQFGAQARGGRVSNFGTQMGAANSATGNAQGFRTGNPSFGRTLGQSTARALGNTLGGGNVSGSYRMGG